MVFQMLKHGFIILKHLAQGMPLLKSMNTVSRSKLIRQSHVQIYILLKYLGRSS